MEHQDKEGQMESAQMTSENMDAPLSYAEREEIKNLSKLFFGSSSRWQKLQSKGQPTPRKDENNQPIVVGHSKRIRGSWGKLTPIYLMEMVTTSPRSLLNTLRAENARIEALIEQQRQAREAQRLAAEASGVVEASAPAAEGPSATG